MFHCTRNTHAAYQCAAHCDVAALDFAAGLGHPETKQYVQPAPTPLYMPLLLFLATSAQLPGWQADPLSATLECRASHASRSSPDPSAFVAGIALILQQFHADCWQVRPQTVFPATDRASATNRVSELCRGNPNAMSDHI